jgi:hypothetical protein
MNQDGESSSRYMTGVAVGRAVADRMVPMDLAVGEDGESARRGHRPKTRMAVFSPTRIPIGLGHVVREASTSTYITVASMPTSV